MDPQKTPNPAPYNSGQQPQPQSQSQPLQDAGFQTSMQDEGRAQPTPSAADVNNEVTVDFNQDAQNAGQNPTQPTDAFAPGAMPSLNGESPQNTGYAPGQPDQLGATPAGPSAPGAGGTSGTGLGDPMGQPSSAAPGTADLPPIGAPAAGPAGAAGFDPAAGQPMPSAMPPADNFQNSAGPAFGAPADAGAQPQPPQPPAGQPGSQLFQADTQAPAIPPTAPTPGVKADKKTIFILAGVAVVLIIAIAVLIFM